MDAHLKPYPSCGHESPLIDAFGGESSVTCQQCAMSGPMGDYAECQRLWNSLPRRSDDELIADTDKACEFWKFRCLTIEQALSDAPKMPIPHVLAVIGTLDSASQYSDAGKRIQRELGSDVVPYVSDCESGAGYWDMLTGGKWREANE